MMALISTIFGPNETSRRHLFLEKIRKNETNEKFSKNFEKFSKKFSNDVMYVPNDVIYSKSPLSMSKFKSQVITVKSCGSAVSVAVAGTVAVTVAVAVFVVVVFKRSTILVLNRVFF